MSQEKNHSPQHEALLKKQALEQQEVTEVLTFIQKYAKPAGIVLVAICAIVLVDKGLKAKKYAKVAAADSALMSANTPEDLQTILNKYAGTPSAPIAMVGLAREKFNEGKIDEAEALYTEFASTYKKHELALQVQLNLISCTEEKGQLDEAQQAYSAFATEHPKTYLAPLALIQKARCLEALGQIDEAQAVYEDLVINYADENWARVAQTKLNTMLANQ
jgi:TolA-binding protein